MRQRHHSEIAFFNHPSLWLFMPEHLFKEQAYIAIMRYDFYMILPEEYNLITLKNLRLNQRKDTFNKWAHNYVNLINKLDIKKFKFHVLLTINDQKKIWLEFLCFVMRLELRADNFITSEISYDLFSRGYSNEELINNLMKYQEKYPFINTIVQSLNKTAESQKHNEDNSYINMYHICVEAFIRLGDYALTKKLSLQECLVIIQVMLHFTCISGYTTLNSYNDIQKYIKDNLILKKDRLNTFMLHHTNFISLITDEDDKIYSNSIFGEENLADIYDKYMSISSIWDQCVPIKILYFFYTHKQDIFYTYISEKDLTEKQKKIQVLEKEAVYYDRIENELAQDIFSKKFDVSAIEEYVKKFEWFKYKTNPHNLIKYRRKLLCDENDIMERKRQKRLDLSVNFFLVKIKRYLSDNGLELSLKKLLRNDIVYDTNSDFWKNLCIKDRPITIKQKTGVVSELHPMEIITDKEELQLCQQYSNTISYNNKFSKENVYKIYLRTFDIALKEELKLYDTFEEKMYTLICFSYKKLYEDRDFFDMKYNNILQFVYYKIFKLCEEHFSVINKNHLKLSVNNFMGEEYITEITPLFQNIDDRLNKAYLTSILNFQLYKNDSIIGMKNQALHTLTNGKKETEGEYLISQVSDRKLIPVVKALNKWLQKTEIFCDNNKSVSMLFILFYMINIEFGDNIFDNFPLNTRANILLLLGEILYYDDNILHQIIGKEQDHKESSLKYNWLNNKGRCASLKPAITDIEKLLHSYHKKVTKENLEKIIGDTVLNIFKIMGQYCHFVSIDLIGFCFIKWLLFDLKDVTSKGISVLERMDIIRPPLIKAPEKITINIARIMNYIFDLERNVGTSCNLNDFYYYYNVSTNIIDLYENLSINPYRIKSQENIIKDMLYLLKNEYNNSSFDKKITCYNTCQLIKKKSFADDKPIFSLNYKLLSYIENNRSIFQEQLVYTSILFSNTMKEKIYQALNSEQKITTNLLIGYAKNNLSEFCDNDIAKKLLMYIVSPENSNMAIVIGAISSDKEFLDYYKNAQIKNKGIYFAINKLKHGKPNNNHHRAIFLKDFFIIERENLSNIPIPSEAFNNLLYTDSDIFMTFLKKFLLNWKNYFFRQNRLTYYKNDRFNMNLDVLKNYAIVMYEKFLKDLPQIISFYDEATFIKNYNDSKNALSKQCSYILRAYQEAFDRYNDKKVILYNHPELTVMQEFFLLILYIKNKDMYNQQVSITGLKTRHLDKFKNEFIYDAAQAPYFKVNDILLQLKNQYDNYNTEESLEKIMQYIYRLEQVIKNKTITVVENRTGLANAIVEEPPVNSAIINIEIPPITVTPLLLKKKSDKFTMKIVSWNVNSVVSRKEVFLEFIKKEDPDIILLQELKCTAENFPKEISHLLKYNIVLNCTKSYNGVAILSKYPFKNISFNLPGKVTTNARYLEVTITIDQKDYNLASIYVPHGESIGHKKYRYKLKFYDALRKRFRQLKSSKNFLILGGDYNVDPSKHLKKLCCTVKEQEKFSKLLELGLINPSPLNKKQKKSLQLDHFLISKNKAKKISISKYRQSKTEMKKTGHAPMVCKVKITLKHAVAPKREISKMLYIVNEENSSINRKML